MRMDLDITVHVDWDTLEATAKVSIFHSALSNKTNNKQNDTEIDSKNAKKYIETNTRIKFLQRHMRFFIDVWGQLCWLVARKSDLDIKFSRYLPVFIFMSVIKKMTCISV